MFNSHVHSQFSSDCSASSEEMCRAAAAKGMCGIAFTDHCALDSYITENSYRNALAAAKAAKELAKKYSDSLTVTSGIEMGEAVRKPDYAERIIKAADFDIVLMSVHNVFINNSSAHLARLDFSAMTDSEIKKIIAAYFRDLKDSVIHTDFDVCAHLTLPLRYITGVYGRKLDIGEFSAETEAVLKLLINRGKALEINTSDLCRAFHDFMPCESVIRRYRELGGELVTIGTDAHVPENIDSGFEDGVKLLKKCGFEAYYRYESRKPVKVLFG